MLYLYSKIKNKVFIDVSFNYYLPLIKKTLTKDDFIKYGTIEGIYDVNIEAGIIINKYGAVPFEKLSSGQKCIYYALYIAKIGTGEIINAIDCGFNAFLELYRMSGEYDIHLYIGEITIPYGEFSVYFDGVLYNDILEVLEARNI